MLFILNRRDICPSQSGVLFWLVIIGLNQALTDSVMGSLGLILEMKSTKDQHLRIHNWLLSAQAFGPQYLRT